MEKFERIEFSFCCCCGKETPHHSKNKKGSPWTSPVEVDSGWAGDVLLHEILIRECLFCGAISETAGVTALKHCDGCQENVDMEMFWVDESGQNIPIPNTTGVKPKGEVIAMLRCLNCGHEELAEKILSRY